MQAVKISNLSWRYPNFTGIKGDYALKNINLEIEAGEFFGIAGSSGAGKTTLCYTIAGLIPHQMRLRSNVEENITGSVEVFGEKVTEVKKTGDEYKIFGKGPMVPTIGIVMQDPESQFLSMSVANEISMGLQFMGLEENEIKDRMKEALSLVGLSELYPNAASVHPSELSGGQKQRLIIASFLAMQPKLLILDEPTSDLDPAGKLEVINTIASLKKRLDITVILVEHNPEVMLKFADRMAIMSNGEIVAVDIPENIYSNKQLTASYNIYTPEVSELSEYFSINEKPKYAFGTSSAGFHVDRKMPKQEKPIIKAANLGFAYEDGTVAISNLNMEINAGEMVALIGQNGSGKSTISKIIAGILKHSSGTLDVAGISVHSNKARRSMPNHVGYVFQNPDHQIFTRSVREEILYGLKNIGVTGPEAERRTEEVLKRVGLYDKIDEDPLFLGRGQKRRLAVASSIAMHPDILIVDEPTTGQDYKMSKEIMDILAELNASGTTIILITHDMRIVAEYCRHVMVMRKGRIIFDGTPEKLFMDDSILELSSLEMPQSARISKSMMNKGVLSEPLISAKEWLEFFSFIKSKNKIEFYTYEKLEQSAARLADTIIEKYGSPSTIIYIERGGMAITELLGRKLKSAKMLGIRASYYDDSGNAKANVELYGVPKKLPKQSSYILIVDELVDSGKTMSKVAEEVKKHAKGAKVVTCALIKKVHSSFEPDVFLEELPKEAWVVFDYEENEAKATFKNSNPVLTDIIKEHFDSTTKNSGFWKMHKAAAMDANRFGEQAQGTIAYTTDSLLWARILSDWLGVKRLKALESAEDLGQIQHDSKTVIIATAKSNGILHKCESLALQDHNIIVLPRPD
ncbi:energy-coupling factor transporter ATPase [Candidatus Marsarchaeota archaeon]|nr:energy-coupling factor transporter ATPase [Candidatus Marsarchaeota archaeon]MCL5404840.1 energy-coupling factor transporter ATPase [Candidatus Marsarchaeota archaeon]